MAGEKLERTLAIFFRGLRGEQIRTKDIANEYGISEKSVARSINEIRNFLADNRELAGHAELVYNKSERCYSLKMNDFLRDSELLAIIKILIGSRALSKEELLSITGKLKKFTSASDRVLLNELIQKEQYHYCEVKSDCTSVVNILWRLANAIHSHTEITISYYKMSREKVVHRIKPLSIMFSEYYFYMIAYKSEDDTNQPVYFRCDRITDIIEHRTHFAIDRKDDFDEGELRKKIQFMFPGKCRKIRFEFSGPSLQAILDRLPTAVVIEITGGKAIVEAEVYGTGIMMYLLSQGSWVKAISPDDFVEEYKAELEKMRALYN